MILSSPLKAPDATNKMLVVSTCTVSPLNFLLFFSGTFMIVPSRSFSKPWTETRELQHSKSDHYDKLHNAKKVEFCSGFLFCRKWPHYYVYPPTCCWFVSCFTGWFLNNFSETRISKTRQLATGVPQSSVLGPLRFLILTIQPAPLKNCFPIF